RNDRAKVNRLRTYLSWKEVRKNVKDSGEGGGGEEVLEDANAEKPAKARRTKVKLLWELVNSFSDMMMTDEEEDDEDDEDAYLDSMQRVKVNIIFYHDLLQRVN